MKKIEYTISLKSDCEIGTGFDTEFVDSFLPRDAQGSPIIPASHIKGLVVDGLRNMFANVELEDNINAVFGREGDDSREFTHSVVHFINATPTKKAKTLEVTRTAIDPEKGIQKDGSLRTAEVIAAGTVFKGSVIIDNDDSYIESLVKLGLLSVTCIGANRNRGMGDCIIQLGDKSAKPSAFLKEIARLKAPAPVTIGNTAAVADSGGHEWLQLKFTAKSPICVPDRPVTSGVSVISSGFAIPATAVMGIILNRVPSNADMIYKSNNFRCFPMHPTNEKFDMAMKVSSTHKISKHKTENDKHIFSDTSFDKLWADDKNNPIANFKGVDGVLIKTDGKPRLYRDRNMKRHISAHAVVGKAESNLYTVDSLDQKYFTGIIAVPKAVADIVIKEFNNKPDVFIGKARSVRGYGELKIERFDIHKLIAKCETNIFVVQSPAEIQEYTDVKKSDNKIMEDMFAESALNPVKCSCNIGVLFGWNKQKGNTRTKAKCVIMPGSVFVTAQALSAEQTAELMLNGIDGSHDKAFGSVMPHFGIPDDLYDDTTATAPAKYEAPTGVSYSEIAYDLHKKNGENGLSASQISALMSIKPEMRGEYIEKQKSRASVKNKWERILEDKLLLDNVKDNQMLKVWHDLTVGGMKI